MIITPLALDISDLTPSSDRSPGVHFSDLLKSILVKMDRKRFGGEFDPEFALAGFIWEELMSEALGRMARGRNRHLTQLEVFFRRVYLTIDTFDTQTWRVLEFKYTEMSSARPPTDHRFWHWISQLKAYCLATGTTEAELWAYFARGNYREKRRETKRWLVKFTARELEENWMMLENARKGLLK